MNLCNPSALRKSPSQTTLRGFKKQSSNKIRPMTLGDGDNARCCRLCGADYNLKFFKDTYIWEGVEEKYDQLLYDCFGVTVSPGDCMICEWCIRALRNTERFRALVHAAFEITASSSDVTSKDSSSVLTLITHSCQTTPSRQNLSMAKKQPQIEKKAADKKKLQADRNQRMRSEIKNVKKFKYWMHPVTNFKRINVHCNLCSQKYPMVVSNGDLKPFVCSRCKKNGEMRSAVCKKCNIAMAKNMLKEHMELHLKADLRGKTRLCYRKKKLSPNPTVILAKQTFTCSKCPMKYNYASHLASHVKNAHGDNKCLSTECKNNFVTCVKPIGPLSVTKPTQCEEFQLLFQNRKVLCADSVTNSHTTPL